MGRGLPQTHPQGLLVFNIARGDIRIAALDYLYRKGVLKKTNNNQIMKTRRSKVQPAYLGTK